MFRCRACGRVAPESGWVLIAREPWADARNIRRYPVVECPACQGRDIDMNHSLQTDARSAMRAHEPPPPHRHEN